MDVLRKNNHHKLLGIMVVLLLALGVFGIGAAYAYESSGYAAGTVASDKNLPEWAIDNAKVTGSAFTTQAGLPEKYDLRNVDGKSYVTSVKDQTPWNTCWAFSGIAAAESSLISDLNMDASKVDLSEKHLIWYSTHPVSEIDGVGAQAGEGVVYFEDEDLRANSSYGFAKPIFVTTLFSSGVGPVSEESFPYKGAKGLTEYQWMLSNPDAWKKAHRIELAKSFKDDEELLATIKKANKGNSIEEYLQGAYGRVLQGYKTGANASGYTSGALVDGYAKHDDWSIPDKDEQGDSNRMIYEGYTLRDGNILPDLHTIDWIGNFKLNDEGMQAAKQELMAGHAISVAYNSNEKYLNTTNWAHYTNDSQVMTHGVTIVGWDDSYPKENFGQGDEVERNGKIPPGNGAWLVKNSWGTNKALTEIVNSDGTKTYPGKSYWGIDGSGYFWISYYDRSLSMAETLKFDNDLAADGEFVVNQYDFMPASHGFYQERSGNVISSANVFTAEYDQQLESLSTRTVDPNTTVTFAVYRLTKDSKTPTDGKLVDTFTNKFPLAGYHRLNISKTIYIHKGERFSVVSTAHHPNRYGMEVYTVSSNTSIDEATAKEQRAKGYNQQYYGVGKINDGESFLYKNENWTDWKQFVQTNEYKNRVGSSGAGQVADNFSIKAYSLLWTEEAKKNHKHVWDAGKETTAATTEAEGVKTYTCTECGETRTESIPKLPPAAQENSLTSAETAVIATDLDDDPANSEFAPLKLTTKKVAKESITLKWEKLKNAKEYLVYGCICGKKAKMTKISSSKNQTATVKKIDGKALKKGTYYKFVVIALNNEGKEISISKSIFVATDGGKKDNPTGITVKPADVKLKVGATKKLAAKDTGDDVKDYVGIRYCSSNEKIAKVTKKGVVKGVKKGTCKVFAFTQNGIAKAVDVTITK